MTSRSVNHFGIPIDVPDTTGMSYPMRCKWCSHVHDTAKVTVIGHYADCSVWRCPNCNVAIDDRPLSWGGSAIPIDRQR